MGFTSSPTIPGIPGLQAALDARALLTGAAFTGPISANNGTLAASAPVANLSQTWNNAAVDFTALKVNVTNAASGGNSTLLDLQVGGVSFLRDRPTFAGHRGIGNSTQNGGGWLTQAGGMHFFSRGDSPGSPLCAIGLYSITPWVNIGTGLFVWNSNGSNLHSIADTGLGRAAAGLVEFNNGTPGQLRDWTARRGKLSEALEVTDLGYTPDAVAGKGVLWIENNGAGKLQLLVRFPTGAPRLLALET